MTEERRLPEEGASLSLSGVKHVDTPLDGGVLEENAVPHTGDDASRVLTDLGCTELNSTTEEAPKKKKKKKKNKSGKASAGVHNLDAVDNVSVFRGLRNWPAESGTLQSFPPVVPIHECFTPGTYPTGEIQEYGGGNAFRMTDAEKKEAEKLKAEDYDNIRRAAECHRQTRKYVQSYCRPGMKFIDICQQLEAKSKELIGASGLECGWGFPTGCSPNHIAAHYTPNYGDESVLQQGDIVKLDFGVHVAGRIIDSAFTIAFDPKFDNLIQATQDGTNVGIKVAGIDARFSEIGTAIQEAIESYEMEVDQKLIPIKPIANLNGHSIEPYLIHGGKSVPIVKTEMNVRMEENEVYAIETFATTGRGRVVESGECSHYMKDAEAGKIPLRLKSSKALLHAIEQNFGTLAFCRRWLDDLGHKRHLLALKSLIDSDIIVPYPPLSDVRGSFTSQMEHTIMLRPTCKEVVSRGPDY